VVEVVKIEIEVYTHPKAYGMSWLQNEHRITVREQCLNNFDIGGYSEYLIFTHDMEWVTK
jgi:hypothetical protein